MKALEEKILIGLGIWLAVLPFTGFPRTWKNVITGVTGVIIIYVAALLWRKTRVHVHKRHHAAVNTDETTYSSL